MAETYRIYVEVTAAMDTVLKFEFPAPPLPPKSSPLNESELFYSAKALYSFKAAHPSEISFEVGEIMTNVHESDEDGWLVGTIGGRTGLIPGR
ncbi:unnamed protein product [Caenorhabditis brenneri]